MKHRPTLPLPYGLEFEAWACLVVEALSLYGVQSPPSEEGWKDWASSLLYNPDLATIPTPYGFDTWLEWASRATETTL